MNAATAVTGETRRLFRDWFWRPPRPHGAAILDRRVSFLELFYDLVYVAVIDQAAHHLGEHVSLPALAEFAVVFALIWFAWLNGSIYLELHGREDGRTRTFVFIQMGILAGLAVFTGDAAGEGGPAFALVFTAFLVVMTWLWYTVRRQDRLERPEFLGATQRYLAAMALSVAVILASAFLPAEPAALRLTTWAVFALAWIVFFFLMGHAQVGPNRGLVATDSLVERFGLFTIIVLGEVVFGVVEGLSAADHDALTIATGMIALLLGFGFWWIYFDVVGHRLPRNDGGAIANWMLSHYPLTLSIAAGGAAVVGLIEHAHDASAPAVTAWLLGGAVAVGLIALIFATRALADAQPRVAVYRPLAIALAIGAAAAGAAGWARPAPWLLELALAAILSLLWCFAANRFLRAGAWGDELPALGSTSE